MPLNLAPAKPSTPAVQPPAQVATAAPVSRKSRKLKSRRALLASLSPEIVLNSPWFISQTAGDSMAAEYLMILKAGLKPNADLFDDDDDEDPDKNPEDPDWYSITGDGIAVLPIRGTLVKSDYSFAYPWATSYTCVEEMCVDAISRDDVKAILFCHDSPGGMASGMMECSDFVFAARGQKPMAAISDDSCYSASYCLATAAGQLFVNPSTGGVGSVGCWMLHVNIAKMLADAGIEITLISSGDKKTDGNQFEALPDRVKAEWKDEADALRIQFAQNVARNRSVSFAALMDTQAGVFMRGDAIPLLADSLGTVNDAMAYLRGKIATSVDIPVGPTSESPGDRESPFNTAIPDGTYTISCSGKDGDGKPVVRDFPVVIKGGTFAPSAHGPVVEPAFALEDSAGGVHSFTAAQIDAMQSFSGGPIPATGELITSTDKAWSARRASLMRGLMLHRGEHPNAIACIRKLEKRASVSGDGKVKILSAPYDGSIANLGTFDEVYRPGCFKDGLSRDMTVLFDHAGSSAYVLGRVSAGTARFYEDRDGLHAEANPPETSWWADLRISMERGDIQSASCAFWIIDQTWENRNGRRTRIVEKAICHDASVEVEGAYPRAESRVTESTTSMLSPAIGASITTQAHSLRRQLEVLRLR